MIESSCMRQLEKNVGRGLKEVGASGMHDSGEHTHLEEPGMQ